MLQKEISFFQRENIFEYCNTISPTNVNQKKKISDFSGNEFHKKFDEIFLTENALEEKKEFQVMPL